MIFCSVPDHGITDLLELQTPETAWFFEYFWASTTQEVVVFLLRT